MEKALFDQRRFVVLSVFFLLFAMVVACGQNQSTVQSAYDAAQISNLTYDTALTTMGDLYKQGFVTEEQKELAIKYGRAYKLAHNAMVEALASYKEQGGDENKMAYLLAASKASSEFSKFLLYVNEFIVKKGG